MHERTTAIAALCQSQSTPTAIGGGWFGTDSGLFRYVLAHERGRWERGRRRGDEHGRRRAGAADRRDVGAGGGHLDQPPGHRRRAGPRDPAAHRPGPGQGAGREPDHRQPGLAVARAGRRGRDPGPQRHPRPTGAREPRPAALPADERRRRTAARSTCPSARPTPSCCPSWAPRWPGWPGGPCPRATWSIPCCRSWRRPCATAGRSSPARLTVVDGAMDALDRLTALTVRLGDVVLVEEAAFPPVLDLLDTVGAEVVPVAMDDDGHGPGVAPSRPGPPSRRRLRPAPRPQPARRRAHVAAAPRSWPRCWSRAAPGCSRTTTPGTSPPTRW